jgi:hypothetical protein
MGVCCVTKVPFFPPVSLTFPPTHSRRRHWTGIKEHVALASQSVFHWSVGVQCAYRVVLAAISTPWSDVVRVESGSSPHQSSRNLKRTCRCGLRSVPQYSGVCGFSGADGKPAWTANVSCMECHAGNPSWARRRRSEHTLERTSCPAGKLDCSSISAPNR